MADRTLKIKGQADFSDIRAQSDAVIGKMDQIAAAAQRATRNVGLATDPLEFMAGKKSYGSIDPDRGPQLVAKTASEMDRLATATLKVRNLSRVLGLDGIGTGILRIRELVSVIGQLGSFGIAGILGGGGAALGLGAIAYAGYQTYQLIDQEMQDHANKVSSNRATLDNLKAMVEEARTTGKLKGGAGQDIDTDVNTMLARNSYAARHGGLWGWIGKKIFGEGREATSIQAELPELIKRITDSMGVSYQTVEKGALDHARRMAEIQLAQDNNERQRLREKYSIGLITSEQYYAGLQRLATKSAEAEKSVLDLREKQIRAALGRDGLSADTKAELQNELQGVQDLRALGSKQLAGSQDRIEGERQRAMLSGRSSYRMPGDELSRIGLFVGGSGDSLPELSKAQLAELKQANAQLRQLPSQLGGSL